MANTSQNYHKNTFDFADPLKGSWICVRHLSSENGKMFSPEVLGIFKVTQPQSTIF